MTENTEVTKAGDGDFGFAIVGIGMIARFHARAIADVPGARVAALVSRRPDNARKLAADLKLDCPVFTSLADALARPDVHAVIVTTPSGAHLDPAVAAAEAGKHVVVEKPLEITAERCDRIIAACDKNSASLCTIFPSRFADSSVALKTAVDASKFGRLTLAETTCKWWRPQSYYDQGGWKGTQALDGGGALMNQAIHNVDLLLWLMGPATHVTGLSATLAHERIEVEDTAVACVRFANGALGVIQATTSVHPGLPKTIAVHGDRGTAVVEQEDVLRWDFTPETAEDRAVKERFARKVGASGGASDPAAISHQGHARQLADFVRAVRTGGRPLVDGREGRRAVEVIEAVYRSARTGRTVELAVP
jgi:predicted dehydrogenase